MKEQAGPASVENNVIYSLLERCRRTMLTSSSAFDWQVFNAGGLQYGFRQNSVSGVCRSVVVIGNVTNWGPVMMSNVTT